MKDELFYLVNKDDHVIGSITRKNAHSDSKNIHRTIAVFILNEKTQMLLQKRSCNKDMDPGQWSQAVGGHVAFGETYRHAAMREIHEELGIKIIAKFLTKTLIKTGKETEYASLYAAKISSACKLNINRKELEEITWVHLRDLKTFIKNHNVSIWTLYALKAAKYL